MRKVLWLVVLAACSSNSPGTAGDDGPTPDAAVVNPDPTKAAIPKPTGVCPDLVDGDVTFAPAGMPPRQVKLDLAKQGGAGPLLFYWYATGSGTFETAYSLGSTLDTLTSSGTSVVTPHADASAGQFEWFIVNQSPKLDDFLLADEIVGCFAQAGRLDPAHIHSMGMSAGALQTTAFSFLRSSYIASVATYSGGVPPQYTPVVEDTDNKFAALIFTGGATDDVFGVDFFAASKAYRDMLQTSGHYAHLCDHGKGHDIPLDAAPSVAQFFAANGFGDWPSPYAAPGLPSSFPSYCNVDE